MSAPAPLLHDHLLDPSGGLIYHLRALRYRHGLWAPFHASVAEWLAAWQPQRPRLVIVGPNAGYALPTGFIQRFDSVTALEPDPLARWLLRRRPDAAALSFDRLDCLAAPDGLARLAAAYPDAAILFSNVLGQIKAPAANWSALLARHLSGHAWASYHDVISTARPPQQRQTRTLAEPRSLEATLAHFWTGGEIALSDHETFHLGGNAPCRYAVWPITPQRWHLVEWVEWAGHTPSPRTSTGVD